VYIIAVRYCYMEELLNTIKGLHPGVFLERELKRKKMPKGRFALSIQEYPQTFTTITKGKRRMNPPLSLKIEQALGLPEGLLMTLQVFCDLQEEKQKMTHEFKPVTSRFRPALFWDIDFAKMDWNVQQNGIIRRVLERGNHSELAELLRVYGEEKIRSLSI